jgi:thiol:disulfide interchange protein
MFMLRYGLILALTLSSADLLAQVKEMNNTEMTEAYIQDGAIVIKQRINTNIQEKKKTTVNVTVGPGKPTRSEASLVFEQDSANTQQNQTFNREFSDNTPRQQLNQFEQGQASATFVAPNFQSSTALAQLVRAQNLVRSGLGLPDETQITQDLMVQYLTTFAGQSSGSPLGVTQSISADGFHFNTPNLDGQIPSGVFPSGDDSMNIEVNNQQVIWNLLFPKQP